MESEPAILRKEKKTGRDDMNKTPKKEQRQRTNSSVDPVNEYLFLTPEVQGDTSFLKKIQIENMIQGKSEPQYKVPLSSPPKRNRQNQRNHKIAGGFDQATSVYSSFESLPADSWPMIRQAPLTNDTTASLESS